VGYEQCDQRPVWKTFIPLKLSERVSGSSETLLRVSLEMLKLSVKLSERVSGSNETIRES
jgi:hypothetical protein